MTLRINFNDIPKGIMDCMFTTENYINTQGFDIKLLELMRLRVSQINQCHYCIDMHMKEALDKGEDIKRLELLSNWQETRHFSQCEKSLLAWTELTMKKQTTDEARQAAFNHLKAFFLKDDISKLTLAIAQINAWNCIAKAFGFEAGTYQLAR